MLQRIMKLEGSKQLSKIEQHHVKGGNVNGYSCPTGLYIVPEDICNGGDHLHPQGHCLCCEVPWQKAPRN
ncbi:hypothetical protein [Kordia sp.]|uniref:hypothetical protein n=1 Tax=Kordia sp. TaxID=1965332 RepID=UPI003D2E02B5